MNTYNSWAYSALNVLICTLVLLPFSSCDDDLGIESDKEIITITIDASTNNIGIDSRAVYTQDQEKNSINRYALLIYDGLETTSKLVGAYDITQLPQTMALPSPGVKSYCAIMLGNVTVANLAESASVNSSTLADLEVPVLAIDRQYNLPKTSDIPNFTWSSYREFVMGMGSLHFTLKPNVAKITATITNSSSNTEATVTNLRVKNVPNKVRFAQNAINETTVFDASIVANGVEYVKYDMEKIQLGKGAETTVSWYVPQNIQGVVSTTGNRADIAPENATYLEVDGMRDNRITASYKIYPGTDKTGQIAYNNLKDFNLYADHLYSLNITITDDGINYRQDYLVTTDHPGETTKVKCEPQSNCWFIHPRIQKTNGVAVWELPIDRINEYWADVKNDASRKIDADSEWTMEVIWQDQNARVIHFCDEYGNYKTDGSNNTYHGFGLNPAYITLDNTTLDETYSNRRNVTQDIYGNVLIGVKKKNIQGYLWSWHLWVTDYCPDYAPTYTSNYGGVYKNSDTSNPGGVDYQGYMKFNISTKTWMKTYDGAVQHLRYISKGNDYKYFTLTEWESKYGKSYWDTGIYKDKWMMDRMLGSQSPSNANTETPTEGWGLFYQYGRKDPFSLWGSYTKKENGSLYDLPCYDVNGNKTSGWTIAGSRASDLSLGVINPTVCYPNNGSGSWAANAIQTPWYSPSVTDVNGKNYATSGKKTLFDPCPPGWCVPKWEAFYPFTINNGYYNVYSSSTDAITWVFLGSGTSASTNPNGEYRHVVTFTDEALDTDRPVFPIQGYMSPTGYGLRIPTENGNTGFGQEIRGYMWTVNIDCYGYGYGTSDDDSQNVITKTAFDTFNNVWIPSDSRNKYGYGWWGITKRAFYQSSFSPSRGHNIRCIQEPN